MFIAFTFYLKMVVGGTFFFSYKYTLNSIVAFVVFVFVSFWV